MDYDLFISHASEDKEAVARPLAKHLQQLGLRVWLDEFELTLGDSLRRKIDYGLSRSRYGIVVLSPAFFAKEWPNKELDGLVAREDGSEKVVLPIWHNVSASDVVKFSPMLADKVAVSTSRGMLHVATTVAEAVRRAPGTTAESGARVADVESESLERMRRNMLTSASSRELRRSMYELESHLARYPHSVEGKQLKDQLQLALRRAEAYERPLGASIPSPAPMEHPRSPRPTWWLIPIAVAGAIIYAALHYFGVI
jgi:hypothetical protein